MPTFLLVTRVQVSLIWCVVDPGVFFQRERIGIADTAERIKKLGRSEKRPRTTRCEVVLLSARRHAFQDQFFVNIKRSSTISVIGVWEEAVRCGRGAGTAGDTIGTSNQWRRHQRGPFTRTSSVFHSAMLQPL